MKECGRCHAMAPETATKCTGCGALLVAMPVPVRAMATTATPDSGPARSSLDPFGDFNPNPLPSFATPPQPAPERTSHSPGMVFAAILVVVAVGAGAYALMKGGGDDATGSADAPVVLSGNEPMAGGIPGALSSAVRVQAESNRQRAFAALMQTQMQADGPLDREMLARAQPDLVWLGASESSEGPKEVSLAEPSDGFVIAISASNKTVCAFGRLPNQGTGVGEYVTMGNMSSCAATDAPTGGWSQLAGGYGGTPPLDG